MCFKPDYLLFHEQNVRAEMLFMHVLNHEKTKETDFEDNEFSQSISQCIEPLMNAYKYYWDSFG